MQNLYVDNVNDNCHVYS